METFNADNTICPWDGTAFQPGEEGMKCNSCGAVMKLESWQEKQSCRSCGGSQAVRAVAVSSSGRTPSRRIGVRVNNQPPARFGNGTANRQENTIFNTRSRETQAPIVNRANENPRPTPNSPNINYGWLIGAGVIVLISSAIALPSFTNQANKAKQAEAQQYVASMNKGQEAVFAEKASFSTNIPDLGLGIKSETENYKYQIPQRSNNSVIVAVAEPKKSGLKGYVGIVASVKKDSTETLFCQESQASTSFPDLSTIVNQKSPTNNVVQCPAGYQAQEGKPQFINLGSSPNSSPKEEVRSQTASPTPSDSTEQVIFKKGTTSETISNTIKANQKKRYVLNCGSGQRMTVQIKQGDINMTIISPKGQTIGNVAKGTPKWQDKLPSDGDYVIEVSAPNQSDYTINIEVLPSKIPVSSTPATNTPVSSTPEQTLKNYYELTVKDSKAAGKKFTSDNFRKKYSSTDADNQKTFVSNFNYIEVIDTKAMDKSPTRAIIRAWLRYSPKDGSPAACEYRDFTLVLNNNNFLIDESGEPTQESCP